MIGLMPGFGRGVVELAGAEHVSVVGHADRRHLQPLGLGEHRCLTFAAPSSIEYSVWLCRCTKDDGFIGSPVYGRPPTSSRVSECVS